MKIEVDNYRGTIEDFIPVVDLDKLTESEYLNDRIEPFYDDFFKNKIFNTGFSLDRIKEKLKDNIDELQKLELFKTNMEESGKYLIKYNSPIPTNINGDSFTYSNGMCRICTILLEDLAELNQMLLEVDRIILEMERGKAKQE